VSSLALISCGGARIPLEESGQARRQGSTLTWIFQGDFLYWAISRLFERQFLTLMGVPRAVAAGLSPEQRGAIWHFIDEMNPVSLRQAGVVFDHTREVPGPRISGIRVPTLVIHAQDDTLQPYCNAEFFSSAIPGARLLNFQTGDTSPPSSRWRRFAQTSESICLTMRQISTPLSRRESEAKHDRCEASAARLVHSHQKSQQGAGMRALFGRIRGGNRQMKKETRNLILFFVATFVWTWACYTPIAIGHHSPYEMPWTLLLIGGGMGPSLVGVAMVLLTFEKERRRDFWRRSFSWRRIRLPWWGVILVTFPLLFAVSIALDLALGGATPGMSEFKSLLANPATLPLTVFISFLSGPWSEEFGWRGYALDPLLKRLGIIGGSCVLGLVWGVWHLPLYFMAGTWHAEMGFGLSGFWTFLVWSIGLSLLITWVYLHTNRSILAALLLHFTANFTSQLVVPYSDRVDVTRSLLVLAIGGAVCVLATRKTIQAEPRVIPGGVPTRLPEPARK